MPELKTNTVKHVYSLRVTSETESWQTIVTAESMTEALKIAAELHDGLDRRFLSVSAVGADPLIGPQNTVAAL